MKQATMTMVLNVSDDFKTGDCDYCPLSAVSCYENHQRIEQITICKIDCTPMTCPLREGKK